VFNNRQPQTNGSSGAFSGMMEPGERVTKVVTQESESSLLVTQADILARALWLMELPIALVVLASLVALRQYSLVVYGELAILFLGACWILRRRSQGDCEVGLPLLVTAALALAYFYGWPYLVEAMDWYWRGAVIASLTILYLSIPIFVSRLALSYSVSRELLDAESSSIARRGTAYMKPIWPWTPQSEVEACDNPQLTDVEDIRGILTELLPSLQKPSPVIQHDTIIVPRLKNGNLRKSPEPGTDEKWLQQPTETMQRMKDECGTVSLYICKAGRNTVKVALTDARRWIRQASVGSATFRHWRELGIPDEQQKVIRRICELLGIIEDSKGESRETVKWILGPNEALAEFERVFSAGNTENETEAA